MTWAELRDVLAYFARSIAEAVALVVCAALALAISSVYAACVVAACLWRPLLVVACAALLAWWLA